MSVRSYISFELPHWFQGSTDLRNLLHTLWNQSYHALYEYQGNGDTFEAFYQILDSISSENIALTHQRYLYIALSCAIASRDTIFRVVPSDSRPDKAIKYILDFLSKSTPIDMDSLQSMFPASEYHGNIDVNDAYDVFSNLSSLISESTAKDATISILDAAINEEAITFYHQTKRTVFNWLIIEVIPSAYHLRLPETTCMTSGHPVNTENIISEIIGRLNR